PWPEPPETEDWGRPPRVGEDGFLQYRLALATILAMRRMSEIVNHYDRAEEIAGPFVDEKKDLIMDWYENLDIPVSPWPGTGLKEYKDVVFKLNNNGKQDLFLRTEQSGWPGGNECGSEGGPVKFAEWDLTAPNPNRYQWRVYFDSARNEFQIRSEHCAIYADEHYWSVKWKHFYIAGLASSNAFTCAFSTANKQYDVGKENKCNHRYLAENWDWAVKQGFYHPMANSICKAVYDKCRAELKEHMVELQSQWGESVGYNRGPLQPNVAWFRSGTFDLVSKTWPNYIFGGIGATLSGTGLSEVTESGHGANKEVTALKGTTLDSINFGDVIKTVFTICSVTRYTGGAFGRILNGEGADWLHGHHGWSNGGKAGVAHYQGWKTKSDGTNVNPITDWVVMCGTNAGSQLKLVNGVSKGTADGGQGGVTLWINGGKYMPEESSDFAVAEVMVWDRGLTSDEMYSASNYLVKKFGVGTVTEVWKAEIPINLSPAMSGNDVLGQIQFPNALVLRQDNSSGIKTFSKYKILNLGNFPGNEEVNKGPWRYKAGDKFRYDYSGEVPARGNAKTDSTDICHHCIKFQSILDAPQATTMAISPQSPCKLAISLSTYLLGGLQASGC
ncbi:hypothetical protein THAOC_28574, partial [Thalassiosira oceanica]